MSDVSNKMTDTVAEELMAFLVGATIVRADWRDVSRGEKWTEHERGRLWLSDGRIIEFSVSGYDAWGAAVREARLINVGQCLNCGQPHPESELFKVDALGGPKDADEYAYCTDGNNIAWAR